MALVLLPFPVPRLYISMGAKRENVIMLDSKGVLRKDRTDLNKYKKEFATDIDVHNLEEAIKDADVFVGLSKGNVLSQDMVKSMAFDPIIFAMANPTPEISYEDAVAARKSLVMATGRSDYPNQVNNVLGFPFIFRGAMDVRATCINEEMKIAAAHALADLAKEPVPEEVNIAYNVKNLTFGREYIIPKPFDPRLITHVSSAVAKAAMDSGVAQKPIEDWAAYQDELSRRLGKKSAFIRNLKSRARNNPKRVVFAEADKYRVLKAAEIVYSEGIATPILLGDEEKIRNLIKEYNLDINGDIQIIDPRSDSESKRRKDFALKYYEKRKRHGVNYQTTKDRMRHRNYFGPMLVEMGYADAMISGLTTPYPETIRPALEIIGKKDGSHIVSGMYIMVTQNGPVFFADTTVNMNPEADDLVEITLQTAEKVKFYNVDPKIALLSYSNFGSNKGRVPSLVKKAVSKLHKEHPDLIVDGEMQANFAMNNELLKEFFPFSKLIDQDVNVLVFPYLSAGNIAYKLVQEMSHSEAIGPVLNGLKKSVHILQMGSSVQEIVNMVTVAVIDAQFIEA
jgi:malate dehydrogenase (oxaloacetate-decarboxylating)(NADP+)